MHFANRILLRPNGKKKKLDHSTSIHCFFFKNSFLNPTASSDESANDDDDDI